MPIIASYAGLCLKQKLNPSEALMVGSNLHGTLNECVLRTCGAFNLHTESGQLSFESYLLSHIIIAGLVGA